MAPKAPIPDPVTIMSHQQNRLQFFVDSKVQGALLVRGFVYWLLCSLAVFLALLAWQCIVGPARIFYQHFDELWFRYAPVFALLLALLPILALDFIKFSNRFAGPVLRLRAAMRQLARGDTAPTLSFRDDDFWQELAADFNRIAARLDTLEAERPVPPRRDVEESGELVLTATD
jgi:nitrogen fixation/metabolism regulation signal transduction histidine kinase